MTDQIVPKSRTYVHSQCGQETEVSGQAFEVVSNPMSSMEQTVCSNCGAMYPISEFRWADTGETITAYYDRYTMNASDLQRFLCSKRFLLVVTGIAAMVTAAAFYALVANNDLLTRVVCLAGGLMIGAMIGMAIFVSLFANPIKRKVCGVSDTRMLR